MKKINQSAIAVLCMSLFFSCGDDYKEDYDTIPQGPKTVSYLFTHSLIGRHGWEGILDLDTIRLSDMIGEDPALNLREAELQNNGTYLEITGLKALNPSPALENVSIFVGNKEFPLGRFTATPSNPNDYESDIDHSTEKEMRILREILQECKRGKKEAVLRMKYKSTGDFDVQEKVELKLALKIKYSWNSIVKK
ncbi:MAG: hypothetical protein LBH12_02245 [Dysgonamonadaceae bacterium]|jgi:hypothetical protein|nr:hypothetical protein [Dysgonamonadaceae bacterium]